MAGLPQCRHVRADGTTCRATPTATGLCYFHDERFADKRAEARRKGGAQTRQRRAKIALPHVSADLPLGSVGEVAAALAVCFNEVRKGELDARTANCLAVVAGTILRALDGEREIAREIAVTVKPSPLDVPLISAERRERLLAEVRARHGLPPVGPKEKELMGPAPNGGEGVPHGD
jgi:hypothetical protein